MYACMYVCVRALATESGLGLKADDVHAMNEPHAGSKMLVSVTQGGDRD